MKESAISSAVLNFKTNQDGIQNTELTWQEMILFLHQNMKEAYHEGDQWSCHGILGRSGINERRLISAITISGKTISAGIISAICAGMRIPSPETQVDHIPLLKILYRNSRTLRHYDYYWETGISIAKHLYKFTMALPSAHVRWIT